MSVNYSHHYIRLLLFLSNVNHVLYYVAVLDKVTSQLVFDLLAKSNCACDACQQFILDPAQHLPLVKAYGICFPLHHQHAETISLIAYKNNRAVRAVGCAHLGHVRGCSNRKIFHSTVLLFYCFSM